MKCELCGDYTPMPFPIGDGLCGRCAFGSDLALMRINKALTKETYIVHGDSVTLHVELTLKEEQG